MQLLMNMYPGASSGGNVSLPADSQFLNKGDGSYARQFFVKVFYVLVPFIIVVIRVKLDGIFKEAALEEMTLTRLRYNLTCFKIFSGPATGIHLFNDVAADFVNAISTEVAKFICKN